MGELRTGAIVASAITITTLQTGLLVFLYRRLSRRISALCEDYSQQIGALNEDVRRLQGTIKLLERSADEKRQRSKTAPNSTSVAAPRSMIFRVDSMNSTESEYADAIDDPNFQRISPSIDATCTPSTCPVKTSGQKMDKSFLDSIDRLHEAGKHSEAYEELIKVSKDSDPEVLWRLARACHQIATPMEHKNPRKKQLLDEGHKFANDAYKLSENDFNVLKWVAAVTGTRTDFLGTKEKIEQGNVFKALLDKALAINPEEYTLLHMRGRFCYSVASLSWLERKAAAALFAAPPEATYDDAIKDFLAVVALKADWLENALYLAKAYLAKGDKAAAVEHLASAVEANKGGAENEEESELMKEAKAILKKQGK